MNGNQTQPDVHGELHRRHLDDLYAKPQRLGHAARICRRVDRRATAYRNTSSGGQAQRHVRRLRLFVAVDPTKTVASITLPNNKNVEILAITAAGVSAAAPLVTASGNAPSTFTLRLARPCRSTRG